jgi:hypothetical protein
MRLGMRDVLAPPVAGSITAMIASSKALVSAKHLLLQHCAYARPQPVCWTVMLVPKSNCVKRSNKRCQKGANRQILYRQSRVGGHAAAQSRLVRANVVRRLLFGRPNHPTDAGRRRPFQSARAFRFRSRANPSRVTRATPVPAA